MTKSDKRIEMMICKGQVDTVDDSTQIQLVKMLALSDEVQEGIERIQDYGFTSNPPKNAESVLLYLTGNKDNGVVIKSDSGVNRFKDLLSGEVCMYSKHGNYLKLGTGAINLLIGTTTIGAEAGALPLLKVSPSFVSAWTAYFTAAAAGWNALAASGLFEPADAALFTAAGTAAGTLGPLLTPCTMVNGV